MNNKQVVGIYPGSFDPITNGHLDLIERGSRLVDKLIVAILRNEEKRVLFTIDERIAMLEEVVSHFHNVEVASFNGLLVDYAAQSAASGRGPGTVSHSGDVPGSRLICHASAGHRALSHRPIS